MKKNQVKSISTKIVLLIVLIFLLSVLVILTAFEKINKKAFYSIEMEKADLVARTIEPLIALNIYLDMKDKTDQVLSQLIENPNILAVKVLKNLKVINEIRSPEYDKSIEESFTIKQAIHQPNSKKILGSLIITYSNKNYKELINQYTKILLIMFVVFSFIFTLFGLYVKKLLLPLRKIAKSLKEYSPDQEIKIPYVSQNNEIGLISKALNNMQQKISQYSKKQKNINQYLEEKVNEKTLELRKQLYTDSLTKLPNRHSLLNDIISSDDGALLVINIDDFREINDFFGQTAGDYILKSFAYKLNSMFNKKQNTTVSRLSGDEFAIYFTKKPSIQEFIKIAENLAANVEKMIFFYENNELSIRVSVGGSYQMENILEKADIALKSAKKQQESFLLYDENLNIEEQYKDNIEWVKNLKIAIENDKIVPYFQAIYDNKSDKVASYECLIRLIDEDGNIISPYKFLIIAKKSRLYSKLTKIMIEKSCKYFENIDSYFSVNVSVEDILNKNTVKYIKQKIKEHNVSKKIIFEILESEGIENYEDVAVFTNEMKALGCRISIDDFGSGYSNFEHLLKLNIDYIKIDGTLIKNIDYDINAQIVVKTIVDFAQRLNILTVAEFVHNESVYKKVKDLSIDRTQGFFLARPHDKI
ncbi:diguanylate cyclase [Sulfurimonas hongkongensis]|uniref:Diguanylate cyclase n=1 Tax=Sulfurimonas hongkongensis TaxID=1172190 RepID=T0L3L9_9BACT|nr:EAL domain-containing protein [Sulfurimonas hongkongensis]EQB40443.1 diguanylate cyclase [Sulfurimonas hongkongensis]